MILTLWSLKLLQSLMIHCSSLLSGAAELYKIKKPDPLIPSECFVNPNLKEWFYTRLCEEDLACPMRWYLHAEPTTHSTDHHFADLGELMKAEAFQKEPRKFICENLTPLLTDDAINRIADSTVSQFDEPLFCKLRQYRLTGYVIGDVINAREINSYPTTLFDKILNRRKNPHIKVTSFLVYSQWGNFTSMPSRNDRMRFTICVVFIFFCEHLHKKRAILLEHLFTKFQARVTSKGTEICQ